MNEPQQAQPAVLPELNRRFYKLREILESKERGEQVSHHEAQLAHDDFRRTLRAAMLGVLINGD